MKIKGGGLKSVILFSKTPPRVFEINFYFQKTLGDILKTGFFDHAIPSNIEMLGVTRKKVTPNKQKKPMLLTYKGHSEIRDQLGFPKHLELEKSILVAKETDSHKIKEH